MSIKNSILETIGNTPLVRLQRISQRLEVNVHAKMERFNPGGSIKDRVALNLLVEKLESGELNSRSSTVIESSSGNLGVGLAQICRYFDIRFICVVDPKTPENTLSILTSYGAEVDMVTDPDIKSREFLGARMARVNELIQSIPGSFWPNQYANLNNPMAHEKTMGEITEQMNGDVDYVFCAVSTIGTLLGCSNYVRKRNLKTELVAVDAVGSVLFSDEPAQYRMIPGFGASVRPALLDPSAADRFIHVNDLECVVGCRKLVRSEAILAGGSSGATLAGLTKIASGLPKGANVALVFPDGGERYIDTIYSDRWVEDKFGDVSHLWKD